MGIVLLLFLISCAPSENNSAKEFESQQSKIGNNTTICKLSKNISDTANLELLNKNLPLEIDTNYEDYIVKFKSPPELSPSGHVLREYGVNTMKLNLVHGATFNFKLTGSSLHKKEAIARLVKLQNVDYIEPDYPIQVVPTTNALVTPDDIYFSKQWFHKTLESLSAWRINDGSNDIVAAVVDTGIDYNHPDLKDNIWINNQETINGRDDDGNGYIDDIHGWNFAANNSDARTTKNSPHGSHVAGLIGATGRNHLGVVGIAHKVKLMALKFMDDSGAGMTSNAVKAINYAIQKKVFIINNSWGSNTFSRTLSEAIARAAKAKILFFAAAGNGNKGKGYDIEQKAWYPASYPYWNVFSVAATNQSDQLTAFSNFSSTKVDVAAPGFSIFSTVSGDNYQMMSGTSMATPIVSGLAVLVKATNPNLDPAQIIKIIRDSSDKIQTLKDKVIAGGRINAYKAVQLASHAKAVVCN